MIVNLKNISELEKLMGALTTYDIEHKVSMLNTIECLSKLNKAIAMKQPISFSIEPKDTDDINGPTSINRATITDAYVAYTPSTLESKIFVELQKQDKETMIISFDYLINNMEVNTMSHPNSHFKFYINDTNKRAMATITIHLNK